MKKMKITLLDGRVVERDLSPLAEKLPVGTPASSEHYLFAISSILSAGIVIEEKPDYMKVATPSQIKQVEIIFEPNSEISH